MDTSTGKLRKLARTTFEHQIQILTSSEKRSVEDTISSLERVLKGIDENTSHARAEVERKAAVTR